MSDDVKALIAEARKPQFDSAHDEAWGVNGRSPADRSVLVRRLADALEAATVAPAVDREALVKFFDHQGLAGPNVMASELIESGILRDVRDVQAEALDEAAGAMYGDAVVIGGVPGWLRARAQAIREARND